MTWGRGERGRGGSRLRPSRVMATGGKARWGVDAVFLLAWRGRYRGDVGEEGKGQKLGSEAQLKESTTQRQYTTTDQHSTSQTGNPTGKTRGQPQTWFNIYKKKSLSYLISIQRMSSSYTGDSNGNPHKERTISLYWNVPENKDNLSRGCDDNCKTSLMTILSLYWYSYTGKATSL